MIEAPQAYLIFFGDTPRRAWWANFLRPGFRHVVAMGWHGYAERWVYFNPALEGTSIAVLTQDEAVRVIDKLLGDGATVLRMTARYGRGGAPATWWCVGAVKSLLGIRSAAFTPWQFYHALKRRGAEPVHTPCVVAPAEAAARSAA